jgi:hypothetical protein
VEPEQKTIKNQNLIFIGQGSQDQIDLTGAGGTLPPSKPTRGSPADPHLPGFRFWSAYLGLKSAGLALAGCSGFRLWSWGG